MNVKSRDNAAFSQAALSLDCVFITFSYYSYHNNTTQQEQYSKAHLLYTGKTKQYSEL